MLMVQTPYREGSTHNLKQRGLKGRRALFATLMLLVMMEPSAESPGRIESDEEQLENGRTLHESLTSTRSSEHGVQLAQPADVPRNRESLRDRVEGYATAQSSADAIANQLRLLPLQDRE